MDLNAQAQLSALVVAVLNAHAGPLALLNPTPDILTSPSNLSSHLPRKQKTSLSSSLVILISCYLDGTLPFLLTRQRRDCLPCWNHVEEWLWYWPGSLRYHDFKADCLSLSSSSSSSSSCFMFVWFDWAVPISQYSFMSLQVDLQKHYSTRTIDGLYN